MGSRTPATPSLKPQRVFLDASVLVAAAGRPEGGSAAILDFCRRGALTPLVSRRVLLEAERNVRKKLSPEAVVRYYHLIHDSSSPARAGTARTYGGALPAGDQ